MNEIIINQIKYLLEEKDLIASLSNITALINESLNNLNWVGFYFMKDDELVLGTFQGKVACTRIALNRGVCGYAARNKTSIIVEDVHKFEDHIACDSASNSELVVPIIYNGNVLAVIDVDSPLFSRFSDEDKNLFENIAQIISEKKGAILFNYLKENKY